MQTLKDVSVIIIPEKFSVALHAMSMQMYTYHTSIIDSSNLRERYNYSRMKNLDFLLKRARSIFVYVRQIKYYENPDTICTLDCHNLIKDYFQFSSMLDFQRVPYTLKDRLGVRIVPLQCWRKDKC